MNDDETPTPNPDRPGVARSRDPEYPERHRIVELSRLRKKTGEYQLPEVVRAVRSMERSGSVKTWLAIGGLLTGGGGVGHGLWRSSTDEEKHGTMQLELAHEREARKSIERDVEGLQSKLEDARLELAVCCDRRK